jgi:hypothetical protein
MSGAGAGLYDTCQALLQLVLTRCTVVLAFIRCKPYSVATYAFLPCSPHHSLHPSFPWKE